MIVYSHTNKALDRGESSPSLGEESELIGSLRVTLSSEDTTLIFLLHATFPACRWPNTTAL